MLTYINDKSAIIVPRGAAGRSLPLRGRELPRIAHRKIRHPVERSRRKLDDPLRPSAGQVKPVRRHARIPAGGAKVQIQEKEIEREADTQRMNASAFQPESFVGAYLTSAKKADPMRDKAPGAHDMPRDHDSGWAVNELETVLLALRRR